MSEIQSDAQHGGNGVGGGTTLNGISASPGISIGRVFQFKKDDYVAVERLIAREAVDEELARLDAALKAAERDLSKIAGVARDQLGHDEASLFEAQSLMLNDPSFLDAVRKHIRDERRAADFAVQTEMQRFRDRLEESASEYHRERAAEIIDVEKRLVRHLQRGRVLSRIPSGCIVVTESLSAADLVLFSRRTLRGCVTDYGAQTAHTSILARALGVPMIVGLHGDTAQIPDGSTIVLDALSGRVIVEPTNEQRQEYLERRQSYQQILEEQRELAPLPSETRDGEAVHLMANLEFEEELVHMDVFGAGDVGLFRTEVLFMTLGGIPSEDGQYRSYRSVVEQLRPSFTTFRMLDLGGDKIQMPGPEEANPALGWRGLRVLMDREDLCRPQLRALLRASSVGPLRIMLPMVTDVEEIRRFKKELDKTKRELEDEGYQVGDEIQVGAMIEVPSAALQIDHFAAEVDFLSIGTNDLTQYVLAVDRGNDRVSHLFDELHPAVLRLTRDIVQAGRNYSTPVSVCGEVAAQPLAIPVLIGLGIRGLSLSPVYMPEIKSIVRTLCVPECEELAETCLKDEDAGVVRKRVAQWIQDHEQLSERFDLAADVTTGSRFEIRVR